MDKNIDLKDRNIVKVNNNGRSIIIDKVFFENGEPSKVLTMSMTDDFGFEAYSFFDDETDSVDFQIPKYDPLYKHLNTLLGVNEDLVIDDDMEPQEKQKYMKIQKRDQDILVNFYNGLKDVSITDKFIITIINIMRDGRSKLDRQCLDTKYRLVKFFRDVEKELLYEKEIDGEER